MTQPQPPQPTAPAVAENADGDWQPLHPLTPWLNLGTGGLIALAVVVSGAPGLIAPALEGDLPMSIPVILILLVVLLVLILVATAAGVFLDYRNRRFRLTDEVLELRSGVIGKKHLQVRFDRLQSVNLNKPLVARLLGLTKLETSGAGEESEVKLSFLEAGQAESLREELLRRASGARRAKQRVASNDAPTRPGIVPALHGRTLTDYVDAALQDFASPELPEGAAPEQSVLQVPVGRLIASTILNVVLASLVMFAVAVVVAIPVALALMTTNTGASPLVVLGLTAAGLLGMLFATILFGSLGTLLTVPGLMNYTVAATSDGVRIGKGYFTQTSDTVPPGRIHCVGIHQPLLWRPFGWYEVKVDRADLRRAHSGDNSENAAELQRRVVLPVGTWEEVQRVLALVLPMHMGVDTASVLEEGMHGTQQGRFSTLPSKLRFLHPFTWRRLGHVIDEGLVYLRRGFFVRKVSVIPAERIQSVTLHEGPIRKFLGAVSLWINTVGDAVSTRLPSIDAQGSVELFDRLEALAIERAALDTSQRWNEAQTRTLLASARIVDDEAREAGEAPPEHVRRILEAEAAWRRDQA